MTGGKVSYYRMVLMLIMAISSERTEYIRIISVLKHMLNRICDGTIAVF